MGIANPDVPRVLHVLESWRPVPSGYASRSWWIVDGQRRGAVSVPAVLVTSRQSVYGDDSPTPMEGVPLYRAPLAASERLLRRHMPRPFARPFHVDTASLVRAIEDAATDHRADIVHVHWASAIGVAAARAARRLSLPLVAELRFDLAGAMSAQSDLRAVALVEGLARRWFERHLGAAGVIVTASDALSRFVARTHPARADDIVSVPNGVEASFVAACDRARAERSGDRARRVRVGTTSRMLRYEGLDVLVGLVARCPDIELVLIGDGPERLALHALAARLAPADRDRVRFAGQVPAAEIPGRLAALDIVAVPRRDVAVTRYASPIKVAEAMGCARAIVAMAVGDSIDLLADGRGVLVHCGDVDAFAREVQALARDPERRRRLGDAARAHVVSNYDGGQLIERYADAYRRARAS